jgi:hypothetical protein
MILHPSELEAARVARNLSQTDLALISGINNQVICRIEKSGGGNCTTMAILTDALRISVAVPEPHDITPITLKQICEYVTEKYPSYAVTAHPDGDVVISIGASGRIRLILHDGLYYIHVTNPGRTACEVRPLATFTSLRKAIAQFIQS